MRRRRYEEDPSAFPDARDHARQRVHESARFYGKPNDPIFGNIRPYETVKLVYKPVAGGGRPESWNEEADFEYVGELGLMRRIPPPLNPDPVRSYNAANKRPRSKEV